MGGFKRVMKRLGPSKTTFVAVSVPIVDPICAEAPQVNLPHVDTQLNMLQHPVLEQAVTSAQTPNGTTHPPRYSLHRAHIPQVTAMCPTLRIEWCPIPIAML